MPADDLLHGAGIDLGGLSELVTDFIEQRLHHAPLGRTVTPAFIDGALRAEALGEVITDEGLGVATAWKTFSRAVVPNTIALDSERFLAFIPMAPSATSVWMDAAVSAASFAAESWMESAGAVAAENQVLAMLASAAGLPPGAGGCFMSGGSIGNLSALAVARANAGGRLFVAVADTAHASVKNSLDLLGLQPLIVPTAADARMTAAALHAVIDGRDDVGIIVAAGGSTNAGIIDDLSGIADVAKDIGAWFHVDGAYGAAALLLPELRSAFDGIDRADSFIVDPHKWLFAPAGSCALIYRNPALAAAVHTQHGPYVDVLHDADEPSLNPCDFGFQLTRRASGLPLWFALAVHGVEAHRQAIRAGIDLARRAADRLEATPGVELVIRPQLGVVLFRRDGWGAAEWRSWAARLLTEGVAFVAPSTFRGAAVGRLVFMHPLTTDSIIDEIIASLSSNTTAGGV